MDGPPKEVFGQVDKLRHLGLGIPPVTELAQRLHERQPSLPATLLKVEDMVEQLCDYPQPVEVGT
jgi:energy-coupling factor transport system ATP-binding protein